MVYKPHPWELPIGAEGHVDRDITANPYDRQEERVAEWLAQRGLGGGDDPIGFLIASQAWAASMVQSMMRIAVLRDNELDRVREIAMTTLGWDVSHEKGS